MNRIPIAFVISLVILAGGETACSETEINISGQVRVRHETENKEFEWQTRRIDFSLLRTRVMLDAVIDGNTHAVVQFQDSRVFGSIPSAYYAQSTENVIVHQAFVQIDRLWADGFGLKAGRFEYNLGNERLFGAHNWDNVGRVWDGFQGWYDNTNVRLTALWLKLMLYNKFPPSYDFDIIGLNVTIKQLALDLSVFCERQNREYIGRNYADQQNFNVYFGHVHGNWDCEANGTLQIGSRRGTFHRQLNEYDVLTGQFNMELGHYLSHEAESRVAIGADVALGGIDTVNLEWNAYYDLYYSGHRFRGYMDYFLNSGNRGLTDIFIEGKRKVVKDWLASAILHYFLYTAKYADSGRKLGTELDLSVSTTSVAGVELKAGASVFFPTETFANRENPDPGWWTYMMATTNF